MLLAEIAFAIVIATLYALQLVLWERKERRWATERARLVDSILARNAGDFRVRQSTAPASESPLRAHPNRDPRPIPIGLDGGAM